MPETFRLYLDQMLGLDVARAYVVKYVMTRFGFYDY